MNYFYVSILFIYSLCMLVTFCNNLEDKYIYPSSMSVLKKFYTVEKTNNTKLKHAYFPRGKDRTRADKRRVHGAPASHQLIRAHITALGISPVPVRNGETFVSGQLSDLMFPMQQVNAMPGGERRGPVTKVHVSPHIPRSTQQRIPGHIVMQPHKHIIHGNIGKQGVGAVLHLPVGPRRYNVVLADGLLGQVQIRYQLVSLSSGQVKNVPPQRLSSLVAVLPKVAKLTVRAVKPHKVAGTLTGPVVENQGPLLAVVQAREGVLGSIGLFRDHHILAETSA